MEEDKKREERIKYLEEELAAWKKGSTVREFNLLCPKCFEEDVWRNHNDAQGHMCHSCDHEFDTSEIRDLVGPWAEYIEALDRSEKYYEMERELLSLKVKPLLEK